MSIASPHAFRQKFAALCSLLVCTVSPGTCSQTDLQRTLQNLRPATSSLSKSAFDSGNNIQNDAVNSNIGAVNNFSSALNASLGEANRPVTDKWALVIGVSKFADPTIPTLRYAAKDAQDFANYLVKNANFAPDHVRVLLNEQATHRQIESSLGDKYFPQVVKKDDLVVVFYSSHGSPASKDVARANYLVAYDTQKDDLYNTGIDAAALTRQLRERSGAERVLIVMDACHSGGAADGAKGVASGANFDPLQVPLGAGQMLIVSSDKDERSWESKRYNNGIFTHYLLQSMDKNGKESPVSTIFRDLQSGVEDEVRQDESVTQRPKLRNDTWTGNDLVLSVMPSDPQPLPVSVRKWFDLQAGAAKPISHGTKPSPIPSSHIAASAPAVLTKPSSTTIAQAPSSHSAELGSVSNAALKTETTSAIQFTPLPDSRTSHPEPNPMATANGHNNIVSSNDAHSYLASINHSNMPESGNNFGNNYTSNFIAPNGMTSDTPAFSESTNNQSTQSSIYKNGKFTPGDGSFTVLMPRPVIDESGNKHQYQAGSGGAIFEVDVLAVPGANQMLVGFADGWLKAKYAQGYTHSAGRARMINGYPGLEFTYGNGMKKCGVVFCGTQQRMITFRGVVGAYDNFNQLMPFFSSISVK